MDILIIGIICYLIGSIPFGYILTKIFLKKDIRNIGSGNIGATNALRTGNKTIGYATLFFDIVKAFIPIIYSLGWICTRPLDFFWKDISIENISLG